MFFNIISSCRHDLMFQITLWIVTTLTWVCDQLQGGTSVFLEMKLNASKWNQVKQKKILDLNLGFMIKIKVWKKKKKTRKMSWDLNILSQLWRVQLLGSFFCILLHLWDVCLNRQYLNLLSFSCLHSLWLWA